MSDPSLIPEAASRLSLRAPAKINWFLRVLSRRDDGYHDIVSVMQCVSLFDEIAFERSESVIVEGMDIPLTENLVYRAAVALKRFASYRGGARIAVKKKIPIAAGLGGGSSDAAFTLKGLNALWGLGVPLEDLESIGSRIGSDVPFFFHVPLALVEGRGERTTGYPARSSLWLVLAKPAVGVSTSWAYAAFDKISSTLTKPCPDIKLFCHALDERDVRTLSRFLVNDLESVVLGKYPAVGEIKRLLLEHGAAASLMSGSGPTVFGVFGAREAAEKAHGALQRYRPYVVRTLTDEDVSGVLFPDAECKGSGS